MKKSVCLTVLLLLAVIQSCSTKSSKHNIDSSAKISNANNKNNLPDDAFQAFLKKFKPLSLPLSIKTLGITIDSSKKLDKSDNAFIKSEYSDEIYAYGILPDTTDTYKIIWLEPTEIEVPVLTTFTKNGKKVREEELGVGGCGSDCGFECAEFITINKDMSIFSVDSETTTKCDTSGNLVPGTKKRLIRYKTGKVLSDGNINLTKILQKTIN